jgi:hypothetical protein
VEPNENGIIAGDWPFSFVWNRSGLTAACTARSSRANALVEAAVRDSATTIGAIRQRPAQLYTGNSNPLKESAGGKKGSINLTEAAAKWLSRRDRQNGQLCAAGRLFDGLQPPPRGPMTTRRPRCFCQDDFAATADGLGLS